MSELQTAQLQTHADQRFVRLRSELGVSSFGINQLILAPGERNRIHTHANQEEVYLVLDGVLTLIVDGTTHEIQSGGLIRVAPESRRQLVNRHRRQLSVLALGGGLDHEHAGRDATAYSDWETTQGGTPQEVPNPENLPDSELVD